MVGLKIHELVIGKIYDIVDNPFPNHILYFVDNEGFLYVKDTIVKCEHLALHDYNKVLKMVFIEAQEV